MTSFGWHCNWYLYNLWFLEFLVLMNIIILFGHSKGADRYDRDCSIDRKWDIPFRWGQLKRGRSEGRRHPNFQITALAAGEEEWDDKERQTCWEQLHNQDHKDLSGWIFTTLYLWICALFPHRLYRQILRQQRKGDTRTQLQKLPQKNIMRTDDVDFISSMYENLARSEYKYIRNYGGLESQGLHEF